MHLELDKIKIIKNTLTFFLLITKTKVNIHQGNTRLKSKALKYEDTHKYNRRGYFTKMSSFQNACKVTVYSFLEYFNENNFIMFLCYPT